MFDFLKTKLPNADIDHNCVLATNANIIIVVAQQKVLTLEKPYINIIQNSYSTTDKTEIGENR